MKKTRSKKSRDTVLFRYLSQLLSRINTQAKWCARSKVFKLKVFVYNTVLTRGFYVVSIQLLNPTLALVGYQYKTFMEKVYQINTKAYGTFMFKL
jgi:hypothetical protein